MHSRIFQLEREPVAEEDYNTEDKYYDGFVGTIADYVSSETDRLDDIQWFICHLPKGLFEYDPVEKKIVFLKGFKEEFFRRSYSEFKDISGRITLDDFCGNNGVSGGMELYTLQQTVEDKYGFYVDSEYNGFETFHSFVRDLEIGVPYYFGGTIDYHA